MNAAQQFAVWLENEHPDVFSTVYQKVVASRNAGILRRAQLSGLGDDGDVTIDTSSFSVPDVSAIDVGSSALDTTIGADSSGGSSWLDSLGSGISAAATAVGNAITNPAVLAGVVNVGAAIIKNQTTSTQAAMQTQVLQAQAQRAASGQSPAPVTYVQASNGQLVPVYQTGQPISVLGTATLPVVTAPSGMPQALTSAIVNGQSQYVVTPNGVTGYTIPSSAVSSLAGESALTQYAPYLLLGLGALFLLKEVME